MSFWCLWTSNHRSLVIKSNCSIDLATSMTIHFIVGLLIAILALTLTSLCFTSKGHNIIIQNKLKAQMWGTAASPSLLKVDPEVIKYDLKALFWLKRRTFQFLSLNGPFLRVWSCACHAVWPDWAHLKDLRPAMQCDQIGISKVLGPVMKWDKIGIRKVLGPAMQCDQIGISKVLGPACSGTRLGFLKVLGPATQWDQTGLFKRSWACLAVWPYWAFFAIFAKVAHILCNF